MKRLAIFGLTLLVALFGVSVSRATLTNGVPDWIVNGDQSNAAFGDRVGSAGDVNGDGFADVLVVASNFDGGQTDEGKVFLYLGSASGPSTTPAWTFESDQADALITSAESAGDVNGDGYADVLVGSPLYDNGETDEGRAWLFLGSASGLSTTPAWTAEVNQAAARFGSTVAGAGDLNGDGFGDVLIGAPSWSNGQANEGAAFVYYGSASGLPASPSFVFEIDQANALGGRGTGAGDVNGDGFADVIIEAFAYDLDATNDGIAFVLYGSSSGLSASNRTIVKLPAPERFFANQVASAGDVNGDGYSDLLVMEALADKVYVYMGPLSGAVDSTPDLVLSPSGPPSNENQINTRFGLFLGEPGDFNGDGFSDVAIGAPDFGEPNQGRVFVYLGSATGLNPTPAQVLQGNQAHSEFGNEASTAGDVNGDGFDDVIVGAFAWDAAQSPNAGRAELYFGASHLNP